MGANSGFPGHIPARADLVLYVSPYCFLFSGPFFPSAAIHLHKTTHIAFFRSILLQGPRSLVVSPAPLQHLALLLLPKSESWCPSYYVHVGFLPNRFGLREPSIGVT